MRNLFFNLLIFSVLHIILSKCSKTIANSDNLIVLTEKIATLASPNLIAV